jgi:NTP pyrophosphohydrolases including oxidative damage repair enzymes
MSDRLKETGRILGELLGGHTPLRVDDPRTVPASVLMPLYDPGDAVRVVFTKRSAHLPHHAGQISFPGGAWEEGDASSLDTALRETQEEIGVPPEQVEVVGRLDQIVTVTNFLITPHVGIIEGDVSFEISPVEVERLVLVPLAKVVDINSYHHQEITWDGMIFRQMMLTHNGDLIWGATARILLGLVDILGPKAGLVARAADRGQSD